MGSLPIGVARYFRVDVLTNLFAREHHHPLFGKAGNQPIGPPVDFGGFASARPSFEKQAMCLARYWAEWKPKLSGISVFLKQGSHPKRIGL